LSFEGPDFRHLLCCEAAETVAAPAENWERLTDANVCQAAVHSCDAALSFQLASIFRMRVARPPTAHSRRMAHLQHGELRVKGAGRRVDDESAADGEHHPQRRSPPMDVGVQVMECSYRLSGPRGVEALTPLFRPMPEIVILLRYFHALAKIAGADVQPRARQTVCSRADGRRSQALDGLSEMCSIRHLFTVPSRASP